jgi:hypothetical protein
MATKLEVGKNMIQKIRVAFKMLPEWMLEALKITDPESESVKYLKFSNGSKITAIPTAADAGRSEALSLLVIDECVLPTTYVRVRNKLTGEVRDETIGNLFDSGDYR